MREQCRGSGPTVQRNAFRPKGELMGMKLSSSMSMGRVAYEHDVRNSTQMKNVDYSKSNQNMILIDKLKDEPGKGMERIASYTDKKYQKYIDEYNKGKKPCRQIKETYSKHFNECQSKAINAGRKPAQLAYEVVIQMGNHDNIGKEFYDSWKMNDRTPEQLKTYFTMIYSDVLREFEERFKHFDVLMASIHFDEPNGTPHMHVIFQPDGQGYEKGLSQQVSLSRALACDGFERRETRSKSDFQFVRASKYISEEIMPEIMKSYGYEWENDGHSIGRAHVDSKYFPKYHQNMLAEAEKAVEIGRQQVDEIEQQLDEAKTDLYNIRTQAYEANKELIDIVDQKEAQKALLKETKHLVQIEKAEQELFL